MRRPEGLSEWCSRHLGAPIEDVLWESGHLSSVAGARLVDGREIVLKARPWTESLVGCHAVHHHVWGRGFPCPQPITPPLSLAGLAVSAEVHLPGGAPGRGDDPTLARRTAVALARLMTMTPDPAEVPTLDPPRPWAGWGDDRADPWPPPDEGPPLNRLAITEKLRPMAYALNERLQSHQAPAVVGHVDWDQGNLRWHEGELVAADDWDSVTALSEAAIVGCSAASFRPPAPGLQPHDWPGAEIADTEEFLQHYEDAAGRTFNREEIEVAWAAGLWQRIFDAAKALAAGRADTAAGHIRDASSRAKRGGLGDWIQPRR